jgi:hypothetical protein
MFRSALRRLTNGLTSASRSPARPPARRASLAVEGLEDRTLLSTLTLTGLTPVASADVEARVYRITNIRANANGISGGGPTPATVTGTN